MYCMAIHVWILVYLLVLFYVMINMLQDPNDCWLSNYSLTEEPNEHSLPAANRFGLASGLEVEGKKDDGLDLNKK